MSLALRPASVQVAAQKSGDPRIGHVLGARLAGRKAKFVLIGFPVDEGVRINGGRVGAADGCRAIRSFFYNLCPDPEISSAFQEAVELTRDLGDIDPSAGLEQAQEQLGMVVGEALADGAVPLIMGGGHETAFGHFLGYAAVKRRVKVVNVDAHLDVRPLVGGRRHSGSPFRDILEHGSGACAGYTVVGAQKFACSKEHVEYVKAQGGSIIWRDGMTKESYLSLFTAPSMLSLDLDSVDQSSAPGVSAPVQNGLPPAVFLDLIFEAGRSGNISSLDLVELNPSLDRDNQTARLAALALWSFLAGRVRA